MDTGYIDTNGVNYRLHDINQVEFYITNTGIIALRPGNMIGCWWPKGTGQNYLEGVNIWFGTVDSETGDTLVSTAFPQYYGEGEFRPGLSGQDPKSDITAIYMYPDRWPPPADTFPMAPTKVVSHQDSWCAFNDSAPEYHDTRPIGIEVYQTGYAWNYPLVQDMIYMIYEARNVSDRVLRGNYLGFYVLPEIGNNSGAGNDMAVAIPARRYRFAGGDSVLADDIGYGWQEAIEPGWGVVPGTIGFDLVQSPFDLVPGHDKDKDGIPDQYERDSAYYIQNVPHDRWDADSDFIPDWRDASQNPQVGMSAFKRLNLLYRPDRDPKRYLTMAGYNFNTGTHEPFDTVPPPPDQIFFVLSCGPFDLMPDSSAVIALGIMFVNWDYFYGTPDTALVLADRWLQDVWDGLYFESGVSRLPPTIYDSTFFVITPNPSNNRAIATLTLAESQDVTVGLFDVCGRKVLDLCHGSLDRGRHELTFAVRGYPQGTYFLVIKTADKQYTRRLVIVK